MSVKKKNASSFIFFNLYRIDPEAPPAVPEFFYHSAKQPNQILPVFTQENTPTSSLKHALSQLQPLAHTFFVDSEHDVTFLQLNDNLLRELRKTWQCRAPAWAVKKIKHLLFRKEPEETDQDSSKKQYNFQFSFHDVGGIFLERSTFILYLIITPRLPRGQDASLPEDMATLIRMMVNSLYYRRGLSQKTGRAARIERIFPQHHQAADSEGKTARHHLQERFAGNSLPLVHGILGKVITIEDIFDSLAGPEAQHVAGDRFLCQSLLVTPEDSDAPDFSKEEYLNLAKLARGQSDRYLLPDIHNQTEFVVPILTFRNVLFIAAGEGLACHVKPGREQQFLIDEFRRRYETIYMLLFVLVIYQRYRLAYLAQEIDGLLRNEEENNELDKDIVEELRRLRMQTARNALRIMNTQPTFLSNYREVYRGLQQAFGIRELSEKLQRSSAELDYLLDDQYRREREKESKKFDMAKVILAMMAELIALPYYLYNLMAHLIPNWMAVIVTAIVTFFVSYFTWTTIPEKQRENIQERFKSGLRIFWQQLRNCCTRYADLSRDFFRQRQKKND